MCWIKTKKWGWVFGMGVLRRNGQTLCGVCGGDLANPPPKDLWLKEYGREGYMDDSDWTRN